MDTRTFSPIGYGMLRQVGAAHEHVAGHGGAPPAKRAVEWPRVGSAEPVREPELRVRRVLLPYSGSRTAEAALDFVTVSGAIASAEVWVLYVRPCDVARGGSYYLETPAEARSCAQRAARRLRLAGVAGSAIVRDAPRERIASTILAEAAARNVSLIVLGTRARGALRAALFGSTSATVTRLSWRPVVLVNASAREGRHA